MAAEDSLKAFFKHRLAQDRENRFQVIGRYVLDRYIFRGFLLFIFGSLFLIVWTQHFDLDYLKCEGHYPDTCKNPFYKPGIQWKYYETLGVGEYGNRGASDVIFYSELLVVAIVGAALAINHIAWNLKGG